MGIIRTQVIFEHDSGLAKDRIVNTWHASTPGAVDSAVAGDFMASLADFYDGIHTGSANKLTALMAAVLSGQWSMRSYDLADAVPRIPVSTLIPTAFTPGSNSLPREVACCMSFRGAISSGDVPARHKGRVFLGPFASNSNVLGSDGKPGAAVNGLIGTIVAAGADLLADSISDVDWNWAVYSPTDAVAYPVVAGWVDNAWDTQRSRDDGITARTTF